MIKYFGTDGIRGRANDQLDVESALRIGEILGFLASDHHRILIGKDTRVSGDLLEHALAAGAASQGAQVHLAGIIPTGAVSMLTQNEDFDYGVVISASHNPFEDNGIKIFDGQGTKLDEERLERIEHYMDGLFTIKKRDPSHPGRILIDASAINRYLDLILSMASPDLREKRIVVDLANGAAYHSVIEALRSLGAEVLPIHHEPDGYNINVQSGSTHPQRLMEAVKEKRAHVGLAFDGDADRLIVVDGQGRLLSGDHYLYILSKAMEEKDQKPKRIVTTKMANLGLIRALKSLDIEPVLTDVGDKYVFEQMEKNQDPLGGEQSGHMIFLEHARTGDGLLSALKFLEALEVLEQPLEELADEVTIYPQVLLNVRKENPGRYLDHPGVLALQKEIEDQLEGEGRLLLRASGTEPLVRVMIEAKDEETCLQLARQMADYIETLDEEF